MWNIKRLLSFIMLFIMSFTMTFAAKTINVSVDMTILWGEELPEKVYLFPFPQDNPGGQVATLTGKNDSGTTVQLGGFNQSLIGTATEQNVSNALVLLDNDGDGIYTGTMTLGNDATLNIDNRLYVRGESEPNNYMNYPKYESSRRIDYDGNSGNENFHNAGVGGSNIRRIYTSSSTINANWSWEGKPAKEITFPEGSSLDLYTDTEKDLTFKCYYYHNDPNHFQWVTEYIKDADVEIISGSDKVSLDGKTVKALAIGSAVIKVTKPRMYKDGDTTVVNQLTINVKDPTFISEGTQTVVHFPDKELVSSDADSRYRVFGDDLEMDGAVPKAINIDSFTYVTGENGAYGGINSASFSNEEETVTAVAPIQPLYLYDYDANEQRNAVYFPIKAVDSDSMRSFQLQLQKYKYTSTGAIVVDDYGNPVKENVVSGQYSLPVPISDITKTIGMTGVSLTWNELQAVATAHQQKYGDEKIVVRLSKIEDKDENVINSNNIRYDIFNQNNPIHDATDMTKYASFKNGESNGYLDFVFDHIYSSGQRTIQSGGSLEVRYSAGHLNIIGLDYGNYRVHLYTLKYSNKSGDNAAGYMVASFENDVIFTAPDPNSASSVLPLYYGVTNVVPTNFPDEIQVEVITKSPRKLTLTTSGITGLQNPSDPAGSPVMANVKYNSVLQVGELNLDLTPQEELPQPEVVIATTTSAIDYPLDIVIVMDKTARMGGIGQNMREAVRDIDGYIKNNTNYDPNYALIDVYESNVQDRTGSTFKKITDTDDEILYMLSANMGGTTVTHTHMYLGIRDAIVKLKNNGRVTDNGNPSAKWIIFISDDFTYKYEDESYGVKGTPDSLAEAIRDNDILLTGIVGVKKDGFLLKDDLGIEGQYPNGNTGGNQEEHYAHLKFIAGNIFKIYQYFNDETKIYNALKNSLGQLGITQRWIITYPTPFEKKDGTLRQTLFDVEVDYEDVTGVSGGYVLEDISADEDRQYRAPDESILREEYPNQVIIFNHRPTRGFAAGDYRIDDIELPPGSRGYRRIKAIDLTSIDSVIGGTHTSRAAFAFDRESYEWNNGSAVSTLGFMMEKVSENGKGTLQNLPTAGSTTKMFSYGYEDVLKNFDLSEEVGDKQVFTWEDSDKNKYDEINLSADKIMFRIFRVTTDSAIVETSYDLYEDNPKETRKVQLYTKHMNIYDGENPLNQLPYDAEEIRNVVGDTTDSNSKNRSDMISSFLEGTVEYVDISFDYNTDIQVYAGTVAFTYEKGKLQIIGLPKGDYGLEAFTVKSATDYSAGVLPSDYKVVTYEGFKLFESDFNIAVVGYANKNNFFLNEYIDTSEFTGDIAGKVKVNFLTKAVREITLSPASIYLTYDDEYPKNHLTTSSALMSELKLTNDERREVQNLGLSGGDIQILPSKAKGFKYPVDIVFCIDNSGSMDEEIIEVRNGIKAFADELYNRGYVIKLNLITFGPEQAYRGTGYDHGSWNGRISEYTDKHKGWDDEYTYDWIAIYMDKWFTGRVTNAANLSGADEETTMGYEIEDFKDALSNLRVTGGFVGYQENGLSAIYYANQKLRANGRGVDVQGEITDDSTKMVMPSIKWVILLSDENVDTDKLSNTYKTSGKDNALTAVANDLIGDASVGDDIKLTVINHIDINNTRSTTSWKEPYYYAYIDNFDKKDSITYSYTPEQLELLKVVEKSSGSRTRDFIQDDREVLGMPPADIHDAYYAELRLKDIGDLYSLYEMGPEGLFVQEALIHAAQSLGVIQRWVLEYPSPFSEADGSRREVDFIFKDNIMGADGELLGEELKDYNYENVESPTTDTRINREYDAPKDNIEVKPESPREDGDPLFDGTESFIRYVARLRYDTIDVEGNSITIDEEITKGKLMIYGTTTEISEDNKKSQANWVSVYGAEVMLTEINNGTIVVEKNKELSAVEQLYIASIELKDSSIKEEGYKHSEGYDEIYIKFTDEGVKKLAESGMRYFHLIEVAEVNSNGELKTGTAYSINHQLDSDPPKLEYLVIENEKLEGRLEEFKDQNGVFLYERENLSIEITTGASYTISDDNTFTEDTSTSESALELSTLMYDIDAGTSLYRYPNSFYTEAGDSIEAQVIDMSPDGFVNDNMNNGYSRSQNEEGDDDQDVLKITMVVVDANFDAGAPDLANNFKITISAVGVSDTQLTPTNYEVETTSEGAVRVKAVYSYTVPFTAGAFKIKMMPEIQDTMGNNMKDAIESIQISHVDNIPPTNDDVKDLKFDVTGTSGINSTYKNYTNKTYKLEVGAPAAILSQTGLRAIEYRFHYIWNESDQLKNGVGVDNYAASKQGNHNNANKIEEASPVTYYGFQRDAGTTDNRNAEMKVDKTDLKDDGSYQYYLHMYDKAGNVGPAKKTAPEQDKKGKPFEKKIYVDTLAPRHTADDAGLPADPGLPADFAQTTYAWEQGNIHKDNDGKVDYGVHIKTSDWDLGGAALTFTNNDVINHDLLKYKDRFDIYTYVEDYNMVDRSTPAAITITTNGAMVFDVPNQTVNINITASPAAIAATDLAKATVTITTAGSFEVTDATDTTTTGVVRRISTATVVDLAGNWSAKNVAAILNNTPPNNLTIMALAEEVVVDIDEGERDSDNVDNHGGINNPNLGYGETVSVVNQTPGNDPGKMHYTAGRSTNNRQGATQTIADYYIYAHMGTGGFELPEANKRTGVEHLYTRVMGDAAGAADYDVSGINGDIRVIDAGALKRNNGVQIPREPQTDESNTLRIFSINNLGAGAGAVPVPVNQTNQVQMGVEDRYGWHLGTFNGVRFAENISNTTRIFVDQVINTTPEGTTNQRQLLLGAGGTSAVFLGATGDNLEYEITMNFGQVQEYAGLWQYRIDGIAKADNTSVTVNDTDIIDPAHDTFTNIEGMTAGMYANPDLFNDENAIGRVKFRIPSDHGLIGNMARVRFTLTDNLGNMGSYFADVVIPDRGVGIRSTQEGGNKEQRSRVKVSEETGIRVGEREEGGKTE